MGHSLRTSLDLLKLLPEAELSPTRASSVGESVLARDFRPGQTWQAGVVEEKIGHLLHRIRSEGELLKRHVDQLPASSTSMYPSSSEFVAKQKRVLQSKLSSPSHR